MALDLANYEAQTQTAVQHFWQSRDQARARQQASGVAEIGERGSVTAGTHMDGFVRLVRDLVRANGLTDAQVQQQRALLTLPGYFRPTKLWDVLVISKGRLVAALEFKSQVGPSFGNNFNNRAEEAIGTAHDFWTAYREGAFGAWLRPFVGWVMLVEDAPASRASVRDAAPNFPVLPEFQGASYIERYDLLCQRLMKEQLYTVAAVITSPRTAVTTGYYQQQSEMTSLRTFVTALAGHIAAAAARGGA